MNKKSRKQQKRKSEAERIKRQKFIFFVLLTLVFILGSLNVAKAKGWLISSDPQIEIRDNIIILDDLTLERKIAQMLIVHGAPYNRLAWQKLGVGGIHLFALETPELFRQTIAEFQEGQQIPFLVTVDLEGCLNPFANFQDFPAASEINTREEAYEKGLSEGIFLQDLGITINLAPVVDLEDNIWHCRTFPGNTSEVAQLAHAYLSGLQSSSVLGTAKHYPGQALALLDPHKQLVIAQIEENDLYPFRYLREQGILENMMVSHVIVSGALDSGSKPAVVSAKIISSWQENFSGLVITDDTMMQGLRKFYSSPEEMYVDLFKAGSDLIINFNDDPLEIFNLIEVVKEAVEKGEISAERINRSVRKILLAKGFEVQ